MSVQARSYVHDSRLGARRPWDATRETDTEESCLLLPVRTRHQRLGKVGRGAPLQGALAYATVLLTGIDQWEDIA